jgi:hypothetical protein
VHLLTVPYEPGHYQVKCRNNSPPLQSDNKTHGQTQREDCLGYHAPSTPILTTYEEGLQESEEEQQQTNQEKQSQNTTAKTAASNQGKRKMLLMDRHVPDPLKQMRHNQAAEAKLLATQQIQRAGVFREQAKIKEAEASEKTTISDRLKTPPSMIPSGNTDKILEANTHQAAKNSSRQRGHRIQRPHGDPTGGPRNPPRGGKDRRKNKHPRGRRGRNIP